MIPAFLFRLLRRGRIGNLLRGWELTRRTYGNPFLGKSSASRAAPHGYQISFLYDSEAPWVAQAPAFESGTRATVEGQANHLCHARKSHTNLLNQPSSVARAAPRVAP